VDQPTKRLFTTREADLESDSDRDATATLLDRYSRDPMGQGQPLEPRTLEAAIHGLRTHPTSLVFLAFYDDQPVGLAICFQGFSTFAGQKLINIHDLVVHPDFRRQGVAQQLLDAVEVRAAELGCCKLTLEVRCDNVAAQSLYLRRGFAPDEPTYEFWKKPLED
jgi:ribosomal protein S18 acetylase RimI-like enzyme